MTTAQHYAGYLERESHKAEPVERSDADAPRLQWRLPGRMQSRRSRQRMPRGLPRSGINSIK